MLPSLLQILVAPLSTYIMCTYKSSSLRKLKELLLCMLKIFRVQKRVIRSMAGIHSKTSCKQMFKELNILTLASLYIFKVTCSIRKYCQSLEQNSGIHQYNTRRKLDIHVKLQKTEIYIKSVINMGIKVYNNLPNL
jgi:hypothetical protein